MLYAEPKYRLVGDRAILVEAGHGIHPEVNQRVRELLFLLQEGGIQGVAEALPGYRSLLVLHDGTRACIKALREQVDALWSGEHAACVPPPKIHEIPVYYGGDGGPDLAWVAAYHRITSQEVVRLHTSVLYRVYMIGFIPGFAYLGQLPAALDTPRRATPRTRVPRGSVAIAQRQTGIYPVESPGGWHLIGWTPRRLFDPAAWPPSPLEMGDRVRFVAVETKGGSVALG